MTEPVRGLDDLCPSRRAVFHGLFALGGVALVPGVISACSSGGDIAESGDRNGDGGGGGSISASDVAVGSAVVVEVGGESVVGAQPTEPATSPLRSVNVALEGDQLVIS